MKKIIIVFVFFVCVSCNSRKNEETGLKADRNNRPESRCLHAKNNDLMKKNNFFRDEGTHNVTVMRDEPAVVDSNPAKIPSLMDPSKSVGLLNPLDVDLADRCFSKPRCDPDAPFRTIDGGCNNLKFPVWGQANTANTRIINANYLDGKSQQRKAISGRELPNSRHVRTTLFLDMEKPAPEHNVLVTQFGQMIAHDTELAFPKLSVNGGKLECCNPDGTTPKFLPKGCLPITIPQDDPGSKKRCMSIPRSADTSDIGCQIQPVRQLIGVSSFIDCSALYGSDAVTARSLRTLINGKLKTQLGPNGKSYLSNVKKPTQSCNVPTDNSVCYASGDPRVNQHPNMAVNTISLMRLHNILCDEFKRLNPTWNDEKIYQEARRLVIAMYQHVTYNEFLPVILGRDYCRANNLLPLSNGFDDNYDAFLNPTTFTSFTAAAYRGLHSYIQGSMDLVSESRQTTSTLRLSDIFLRPDIAQNKDNYDSLVRGMLTQHAQGQDQFFTKEITEFLFRSPNKTDGSDLITLDMERGRDFGEPPYNKFRQLCGLRAARTFGDLTDQISKKNVDALASMYEHVDDVDYYAAGILEKQKPGSIFGHTFQCVIGEMFFRWKFGDRFYYEFGKQPGSFSLDQLKEIRKTTLAFIMCVTSDIRLIQRNAFDVPSGRNPLVSCNSITKLNLAPWINS
ncbi:peroxidase-like [Metopolophium dirhodum]|uniref:peroxidase-like n=1 Tax=Metopolophium dirhodum TaxID=44670 RepID=UPI00298F6DB0|nr:peroxidase-like [Metopolophium dirhodum]